ncbi:MAG: biopolymer transporter ExbD [Bdellovibrionota bacterium]|nr:biopolymer transporter ExbD [Bdellovibrionota bacterium]
MAIHLGGGDGDDDQIMADINMTPLIDIMLVLLILFMVTSSVSLESGLDVDLPEVAGQTEAQEGTAVIISLDNSGSLSVQGRPSQMETLGQDIRAALESEKTGLVILEGDRQAKLGNAVQIMDIAKAAGAKKFAIAAEATP